MPSDRLDGDRVLAWLRELIEQTCPSPPALLGHLLGGAMAARLASDHGDQLSELVLVDTFGLGWNRPALRFAIPLAAYVAHPTEPARDRFLAQCFMDFDGLRDGLGERFEPFGDYSLALGTHEDRERRASQPAFGVRHPAHSAG